MVGEEHRPVGQREEFAPAESGREHVLESSSCHFVRPFSW
jgi:hypothetical protein